MEHELKVIANDELNYGLKVAIAAIEMCIDKLDPQQLDILDPPNNERFDVTCLRVALLQVQALDLQVTCALRTRRRAKSATHAS